jgi:hypothetical protein
MTEWPYDDAYQDDPLAALRIPVVGSPWPGWKYEVALCCPNSPAGQDLYPSLRPDEAEIQQILSYIEFRMDWYNSSWKAKMRRKPLDTDAGTNTVILRKYSDGGWAYRRASWQTGPMMVPAPGDESLTLEQLLDRINSFGSSPNPRWQEWKATHPEIHI